MLLSHLSLRTRLDCGVALNMQIPLKETTANPVHSKKLPLSHLPCSLSSHPPLSLCAKHRTSVRGKSAGSPFSACLLSHGLCFSSVNPNNMGKGWACRQTEKACKVAEGRTDLLHANALPTVGDMLWKVLVVCPSSDADQFPCNKMFVKERLSGQTSP